MMTPDALRDLLSRRVYGEPHAHGETDGVPWDVRAHPRTGRWRATVAVPWAALSPGTTGVWDSEDSDGDTWVLGLFCDAPDPRAALDLVRARMRPREGWQR